MSLVYEALTRARRQQEITAEPDTKIATHKKIDIVGNAHLGQFGSSLTSLYGVVQPLLDKKMGGTIIQFIAATSGEGTSTIAKEFAYLSAVGKKRNTLLIDGNTHRRTNPRIFNLPIEQSILESLRKNEGLERALQNVNGTSLFVGSLLGNDMARHLDVKLVRQAYEIFRQAFDLTIIDCSPVTEGKFSEVAPESADGTVLVIEAEKNRPAVVEHAKGMLAQAGGELIGAVLNKRTNYIPDFIYRML